MRSYVLVNCSCWTTQPSVPYLAIDTKTTSVISYLVRSSVFEILFRSSSTAATKKTGKSTFQEC